MTDPAVARPHEPGDATLAGLDAAFAPWRGVNFTAQMLLRSFGGLHASGRTWFCISGGQMYTGSAATCSKGFGGSTCGICASYKLRKDAIHHMVLQYLARMPQPDMEMCVPFNCGDAPKAFTDSMISKSASRRSASRPLLTLSYTTAPSITHDIAFPDYRDWQVWPNALAEADRAPTLPWALKKARAVIPFGNYSFLCGDDRSPQNSKERCWWYTGSSRGGGVQTCDGAAAGQVAGRRRDDLAGGLASLNRTYRTCSPIAAAGPLRMALRHALVHGDCERHGELEVVNGGIFSPRGLAWLPKEHMCGYKYLVLSTGTSNWLSHFKESLLCGSVVIFVADTAGRDSAYPSTQALAAAVSPLTRLLVPDEHFVLLEANSTQADRRGGTRRALCDRLAATVASLVRDDKRARRIATKGLRLVRQHYNLDSIYSYMDAVFHRLAAKQSADEVQRFIAKMKGVPVDESNYSSVVVGPRKDPYAGTPRSMSTPGRNGIFHIQ